MIPIADENPSGSKPYVVYVLVALNVLVYVYQLIGGNIDNLSMIPLSVLSDERVQLLVNQYGQYVGHRPLPGVGPHPQWITIFTSMFMHASFWHIAGNMLYLWIFGNNVEDALGHIKFLAFYIVCGVLAAVAHILTDISSDIPTVGASGAIAGVLGAYLYLYPRNKIRALVPIGFFLTDLDVPAVLVLGIWFLSQLMGWGQSGGQIGGGVAYGAHVGGFVAGLVIILLLGGKKLARPRRGYYRSLNRY